MKTVHNIINNNSQQMNELEDNSIDLVVTSPPYPMIEMWDETFSNLDPDIKKQLDEENGNSAFELMHQQLNKTWNEIHRVLKPGGIACINIGDATRKLGNQFRLYSNHAKIINYFSDIGFSILPDILWRKQSNKPNKFMGSGMIPPNAYATLEHEYILIFRKGTNRIFSKQEKKLRYESAYFWEERNTWFSDIWFDVKGTIQTLNKNTLRERSAAYPFDLPYRLIHMYSIKNDTVLDPFWGTGTTTLAAISSMRNSIGYEIDSNFTNMFNQYLDKIKTITHTKNKKRLQDHLDFVKKRKKQNHQMKYKMTQYNTEVITKQEQEILFYDIESINTNPLEVTYKKYKHETQKKLLIE
jgi:DNA modification methylase